MSASGNNGFFESLETALDRFFSAPANAWQKFAEKFFQYTYRETREGVLGLFNSPEKIKEAAKETHGKGYTNFDCLTPFPVHGLEHDMGLDRSKIPYITIVFALTGTTVAFLLQFVIHEQVSSLPYFNSYPLNIGGKPSFSWPAMIPVMFELTILFGGLSTVAGLLLLGKIPKPSRKILHPELTNDRFGLWIPSDSAGYSEEGVKEFMKGLGAEEITVVKDDER